jgi:type II secretory pathway predicted ATPase ExeA
MNAKSLNEQAKRLWGASRFPFGEGAQSACRSEPFTAQLETLQHWLSLHNSGFIHGNNGVGKSYLVGALLEDLNEKAYFPLLNTHSTLRGPGLIRILTRQLGSEPTMRREDNIALIHQRLQEQYPRWPVLVFDESQNLSAEALEEIRLLNCHRKAGRNSFSTLFVGDQNLMPRLLLGVNQPLLSRMSFSLEVRPFEPDQSRHYIEHRLEESMIHSNPFEEPALNALIESANGNARLINTLARDALQRACKENENTVTQARMQQVIESIPWLKSLRPSSHLSGG